MRLLSLFTFFLLTATPLMAAVKMIHPQKVEGIRKLNEKIEALHLPVHDTVFVFDLDGVLTNESYPTGGKAYTRGDAVDVFKALHAKGYKVLVSSAWNKFDESIKKIKELGLAQELGFGVEDEHYLARALGSTDHQNCAFVTERGRHGLANGLISHTAYAIENCLVHAPQLGQFSFMKPACSCDDDSYAERKRIKGDIYRIMKKGNLVSVAGANSYSGFFRQKAVAPLIAYPNCKFKNVIFVDDSDGNIKTFEYDVKLMPYTDDADVYTFELPRIYKTVQAADKLDGDSDEDDSSAEYPVIDDSSDEEDGAATTTTTTISTLQGDDDDDESEADEKKLRESSDT